jgi:hypothetical protein
MSSKPAVKILILKDFINQLQIVPAFDGNVALIQVDMNNACHGSLILQIAHLQLIQTENIILDSYGDIMTDITSDIPCNIACGGRIKPLVDGINLPLLTMFLHEAYLVFVDKYIGSYVNISYQTIILKKSFRDKLIYSYVVDMDNIFAQGLCVKF